MSSSPDPQSPAGAQRPPPTREELMAQLEDLRRRAVALDEDIKRRQRGQARPGRLLLVGAGAAGIGVVIYLLTGSILWTALGVGLGIPATVFLVIVVIAVVQHTLDERARASEVPVGTAQVWHDPDAAVVELRTELRGDQLLAFMAWYFDFSVVRWGAREWDPADHGGRLVPAAEALLRAAKQELDAGLPPSQWSLPSGTYSHGAAAIPRPRNAVDLDCRLGRRGKTFALSNSEQVGALHKGEVCTGAFPAVLADVLRSERVDARALCELLLAMCDEYRSAGSSIARGRAADRALKRLPHIATRLLSA
jgi:hypothetical protein